MSLLPKALTDLFPLSARIELCLRPMFRRGFLLSDAQEISDFIEDEKFAEMKSELYILLDEFLISDQDNGRRRLTGIVSRTFDSEMTFNQLSIRYPDCCMTPNQFLTKYDVERGRVV
jgi:hypothetical protein